MRPLQEPPRRSRPLRLGFGLPQLVFALLVGAALPASIALGIDGTARSAIIAALSGLAVLFGLGLLGYRHAASALQQHDLRHRADQRSNVLAIERTNAVLQSLREGVVVVDHEQRVVLANRMAMRVLNCGDEMIGHPVASFLEPEFGAILGDALRRMDETGAEETTRSGVALGGRIFDLSVMRLQSEQPLLRKEKAVVLVDSTHAHELGQLKDELLSSISHELRTPLTNMCSSSEILVQLAASGDHDLHEFVQVLHAESNRLKGVVDDVLEYNQLESGQLQICSGPVDLVHAVRSAAQALQQHLEENRLRLELHTGEHMQAFADQRRVGEVVLRLLDNAIRFTPAGGTIRIDLDRNGDIAEVTVADSGPGIPAHERQRVFERFSQLGNVLTEKPKGAGLGLSICQRLVDAMGGTIWADDSPLGGAAIRFVLPVRQLAAQPQ